MAINEMAASHSTCPKREKLLILQILWKDICHESSHACHSHIRAYQGGAGLAVGIVMTCSAHLRIYTGDAAMAGCISAAEGRTQDCHAKSELKLFSTSLQENEYTHWGHRNGCRGGKKTWRRQGRTRKTSWAAMNILLAAHSLDAHSSLSISTDSLLRCRAPIYLCYRIVILLYLT